MIREIDEVTAIGQRRRPEVPKLARRAIERGDVSDRPALDTDLGDSPGRPGREQNGVRPDPCSARIRRSVADDACRVARELEHFHLAGGEEADRLAVRRPERPAAVVGAGQHSRRAGVERSVPDGPASGTAVPCGEHDVTTVGRDRWRFVQDLPFGGKIDDDAREQRRRHGVAPQLKHERNADQHQNGRGHAHPRDRPASSPRWSRVVDHRGCSDLRGIARRTRLRRRGLGDNSRAVRLDRHEQSIAAPWNRLDESRRVR